MKTLAASLVMTFVCCPLMLCQTVTVTAEGGPDESISQSYMALDSTCRGLVNKRDDPKNAMVACKIVSEEADKFSPQSHFISRRGAYVYYTMALIQGRQYQDAIAAGDKAVAVVALGHDDASGSAAAYGARAQAKAFGGDPTGSDRDFETAERFQRAGLKSPAGQALPFEYAHALKGMLTFHAEVLHSMGREDAAKEKLGEASKL